MAIVFDFFIEGHPQPFPKKRVNRKTGMIYTHDKTKHTSGVKKAWASKVRHIARAFMDKHKHKCPCENTPVKLDIRFYKERPKTSAKKMIVPYKKPDLDNYAYAISNALSAICYWDDSRVVEQCISKHWADEEHPVGARVVIEVGELYGGKKTVEV